MVDIMLITGSALAGTEENILWRVEKMDEMDRELVGEIENRVS